ncbi:MAG: ABC transporter ATP-binding protein [Clostridiales bacterium]|nr:ABC transporter ATP-binding protein [Clostridiales bacterium]
MLRIKNFTKIYKGGKKAVDNLSLSLSPGDIYGFIGHNGAGKTTTLKAVSGILDFKEGEILIDGFSIKDNPVECKQKLAYIPDNPDLYEHLTGLQYINFIADVYRVPQKEREVLINEYGDLFDISKDYDDLISSYSHGMKQKIAIIAALVHTPKLLILDEPFVGLDPKASHDLKQIFARLCEDGSAIIFSTHVLEVAEKLCNKIGIIQDGKLVADGLTGDVIGDRSLEDIFLNLVESREGDVS